MGCRRRRPRRLRRRGGQAAGERERQQRDQREHGERGAQPVEAGARVLVDDRVAVARATPASSSAVFEVGVGDERDPARQLDLRLSTSRRRARPGCPAMPVKNDARQRGDQHRAGERGPDRRAEVRTVFWRPPTSPLCSSGTAETVTAPSCEASAPMPRPASSSGHGDDLGAGADVERGDQHDQARRTARGSRAARRAAATRSGSSLGTPDRREQQRDRQRQEPHARCRSPRARARPTGTAAPRRTARPGAGTGRRTTIRPAAQQRVAQHRRVEQRARAAADAVRLPAQEQPQHDAAAEHQPDHRRQAEPLGRVGLGLDEAPGARRAGRRRRRARGRAPTAPCRRGRAWRPPRPACRPSGGRAPGSPATIERPRRRTPSATRRRW